jgi:uncharacterized protein YyaL (SSP411 family)
MSSATQPTPPGRRANRLANESSPYLLQHQNNPVDWYPWGPEAFAQAARLDRPIFLSVGYSTCYWCHVMERQSFENEAIAAEMNRRFISIKVDREERPDVDQLYMTAVQLLTRHGGWPMSVFLTPDLRPFYGGTYFSPVDQQGRAGFPTVMRALEDAYKNHRQDVESTASQLLSVLSRLAEPPAPRQAIDIDAPWLDELIDRSISDYDAANGGFGSAPKFPRQTLLELLLSDLAAPTPGNDDRRRRIQEIVLHTLDALARGGIRDQLGGGFHRYSTDARWLVPHFEIMLYDNAMLAWCYVEAFRQTKDARWADVARGIFDFVLREMTSSDGAFFTAFDAEVDAKEGEPYLWTPDEIRAALGNQDDADYVCRKYGLDHGFNFADPHHGTGRPDRNVLYLPGALEPDQRLDALRLKLRAARAKRKQPLLDTKILTSWNALMIRALAHGGAVLKDTGHLTAARRAAEFLWQHHRKEDGSLLRSSGGAGRADAPPRQPIAGFLDDYAFFAQALIALADADGSANWKQCAQQLADQMIERFGDVRGQRGFYFTDHRAKDLIVRQKIVTDSPLPSGNAVAIDVLVSLDRAPIASAALSTFASSLAEQAEAMSAMVQAAMNVVKAAGPLHVEPPKSLADQAGPVTPAQRATEIVSIKTEWATPTDLRVHLDILPGFHLNAQKTSGSIPLLPTTLIVAGAVATVEYPPPQEMRVQFSDEPILVYTDRVTLHAVFSVPVARPELILTYQACDDSACLPPVKKRFILEA